MKNFAGINFRESPILKDFAGINFRESAFLGIKNGIYFREFGQNSWNSQSFLPAKISSLKVSIYISNVCQFNMYVFDLNLILILNFTFYLIHTPGIFIYQWFIYVLYTKFFVERKWQIFRGNPPMGLVVHNDYRSQPFPTRPFCIVVISAKMVVRCMTC